MTALDNAAFVISIDTELAWSAIHHPRLDPQLVTPERSRAEREIVADLLALFEAHDISATWAVVGHLFLRSCSVSGGKTHPEIRRPGYGWLDRDWYARDPGTDVTADPMWYGPDLVRMIGEASPRQEIGSHSFSHLIAGDPGCGVEAFTDDLEACRRAAAGSGVSLESFVFPRNTIGHLEALADAGFTSYRGLRPDSFPGLRGSRRRFAAMIDKVAPLAGSTVYPRWESRLWNIPATNLFAPFDRSPRIPLGLWVRQQTRRLHQAARHRALYHLWFHPHNLLDDPVAAISALETILRAADRLRAAGRLENLTMADLVGRLGDPR